MYCLNSLASLGCPTHYPQNQKPERFLARGLIPPHQRKLTPALKCPKRVTLNKMQLNQHLKRVIKHRPSGRYYAGSRVWTKDPNDAKVFSDLSVAMEAAHDDGLEDCCIIAFRTGSWEIDAQFPIWVSSGPQ